MEKEVGGKEHVRDRTELFRGSTWLSFITASQKATKSNLKKKIIYNCGLSFSIVSNALSQDEDWYLKK